jgi:hypothetical protein
LAGKEAYVVRHPYPCSLDELYECMSPFCEAPVQAADALTPQETLASRFARPTEVTPI